SGLFKLMRNFGGAIGIARIDTIIYPRSEPLGQALWTRLQTCDIEAATFVGAPLQTISGQSGSCDADTTALLDPLVQI
ncbi:MFS transporter, partial [Rhizobium ruizarguesonis]